MGFFEHALAAVWLDLLTTPCASPNCSLDRCLMPASPTTQEHLPHERTYLLSSTWQDPPVAHLSGLRHLGDIRRHLQRTATVTGEPLLKCTEDRRQMLARAVPVSSRMARYKALPQDLLISFFPTYQLLRVLLRTKRYRYFTFCDAYFLCTRRGMRSQEPRIVHMVKFVKEAVLKITFPARKKR